MSMTEQEQIAKLESILGKDSLAALTAQLVARHGNKLEEVLMNALTHLDKNYDVGAVGELLENGQLLDVDRISEFAAKGSQSQLEFPSMKSDSGVKEEESYDNKKGLNFPSMRGGEEAPEPEPEKESVESSGGLDFSGSMQEYNQ